MATRKLERKDWADYLERLSGQLGTKLVEIEVAGLDLGDQLDVEWVPLRSIAYDPKDRVIRIHTDAHEHVVHDPREVWVDEDPEGLHSLALVDDEAHLHIVKVREPLALPPPRSS